MKDAGDTKSSTGYIKDTGGTQSSTATHSDFLVRPLEMTISTASLTGNLPHAGKRFQGDTQGWVKGRAVGI